MIAATNILSSLQPHRKHLLLLPLITGLLLGCYTSQNILYYYNCCCCCSAVLLFNNLCLDAAAECWLDHTQWCKHYHQPGL